MTDTNNNPYNTNFMGLNNFVWFFGKVVDRDDPEELGRVRVRAFGFHPQESTPDSPTDMLPWAICMNAITSSGMDSKGTTPLGLEVGSVVFGFWADGNDGQIPIVLGSYAGRNDINQLALGKNTLPKKETQGIEPVSPYAAEYPYNKVRMTESGHQFEVDDTPGAERLHVWHRTGTYDEIGPQGDRVSKVVRNRFTVTVNDDSVYIGGDCNVFIIGNANIDAFNDAIVNISGDARIAVKGDYRLLANNIYIEAQNAINVKAGTDTMLDAAGDTYIDYGVAASSGLAMPTDKPPSVTAPTIADYYGFADDDEGNNGSAITALVNTGIIDGATVTDMTSQANTAITTKVPASNTICNGSTIIVDPANIDNIRLSTNFTVGKLSRYALAQKHAVIAQNGLTQGEIVCNLKLLAENTLELIRSQYPTMQITSGFRQGAGTSQHKKGQAADIQYSDLQGLSLADQRKAYYDRAVWIINNVPFDQFLLEYKTYGSGKPWHHISFNKAGLRHSVLTFNNDKNVGTGLHWLTAGSTR